MDRITGMQAFVAAVESGSFTAAADRLGLSKKLVSKYVGALEERLDARLLHRTTRRHGLTAAGQRYYRQCLAILDAIDAAEADLREERQGLSGLIRIAAPTTFGELSLLPTLTAFQAQHPELTIDLRLSDQYVDLAEAGVDLAIRIGRIDDSALMSKRLAATALWTVASPDYLAREGAPETPRALAGRRCIHDSNIRSGVAWRFQDAAGGFSAPIRPSFIVDSARATLALARAGQGVALCPDFVAAPSVAEGALIRLFEDFTPPPSDIRVVYLQTDYMPARVRSLIDFLAKRFVPMDDTTNDASPRDEAPP